MKPFRFTRGSRKHRIGRSSVRYVIEAVTPTFDQVEGAVIVTWVGDDERGRELEIIAIERPDCWLVIHVMPRYYRRPYG